MFLATVKYLLDSRLKVLFFCHRDLFLFSLSPLVVGRLLVHCNLCACLCSLLQNVAIGNHKLGLNLLKYQKYIDHTKSYCYLRYTSHVYMIKGRQLLGHPVGFVYLYTYIFYSYQIPNIYTYLELSILNF